MVETETLSHPPRHQPLPVYVSGINHHIACSISLLFCIFKPTSSDTC